MNILNLVEGLGLSPKRTASTNGGEYHSSCPSCGGTDRFCIWPSQGQNGRYWCRQCDCKGDVIQFCRDYFGLSFKEACLKVGVDKSLHSQPYSPIVKRFEPVESSPPCSRWSEAALSFIDECHSNIWNHPLALDSLLARGLTEATIKQFKLGWNTRDRWMSKNDWGLEDDVNDSSHGKQWLPKGWVIPVFQNCGIPIKLKIRRGDWNPTDEFPKYIEVSGSQNQFAIFGHTRLPIVLVEAEFDAILVNQEAGQICCSIALGGAGKRPDKQIHRLLKSSSRILFSLDFDEAGRKVFPFWKRNYLNLVAWPSPLEKSPEEAFKSGVDIYDWIKKGL